MANKVSLLSKNYNTNNCILQIVRGYKVLAIFDDNL